jgi:AmmeMemoRadiSam system protein A
MRLNEQHRTTLRQIARASIQHGLSHGCSLMVDPTQHQRELQGIGASFVTLKLYGQLRGCIGTLEASRPLVVDIAHNAFNAAFRDPRFSPVDHYETEELALHISVLSAPEAFPVRDESELLQRLRPGVDGLILAEGSRRGTFLPSVWEQLPEPGAFLAHLKLKAGLPADHWSSTLRVERYTVEAF